MTDFGVRAQDQHVSKASQRGQSCGLAGLIEGEGKLLDHCVAQAGESYRLSEEALSLRK